MVLVTQVAQARAIPVALIYEAQSHFRNSNNLLITILTLARTTLLTTTTVTTSTTISVSLAGIANAENKSADVGYQWLGSLHVSYSFDLGQQ